MSDKLSNFRLGLFILAAFLLLVVFLVFFGPGGFWQDKARLETYLDGSVQGLDVGSAVKMRGVRIGNIERIGFVNQKYPECAREERLVLLEMEVLLKHFPVQNRQEFANYMQEEVQKNGLRIRIMPQGLTGSAFLELDYVSRQRHPEPQLKWDPEHTYVPSAPGTRARLEETLESISQTLQSLEKVDWTETFRSLNFLLHSMQDKVAEFPSQKLGQQLQSLLQETRQTNQEIRKLLGAADQDSPAQDNLQEMISQVSTAAADLQVVLNRLDSTLSQPEGGLQSLQTVLQNLEHTSQGLPGLTQDLSQNMHQIQASFAELEQLLNVHGQDLGPLLRDLSATLRNLRALSSELRRYPGSIFLAPEKEQEGYLHD
ncbi:MAG: MlaD family protein [Desulfohalobiaceae bacterium]